MSESVSVSLFIEPCTLGAVFVYLAGAKAELENFIERHPERMDSTIADVHDHVAVALAKLDSDYYTERNAAPYEPTGDQ